MKPAGLGGLFLFRAPRTGWTGLERPPYLRVFLLLACCYAFFYQGGGWNQNSRFDQVRSVVESGSWAIDDFLVYDSPRGRDGRRSLRRLPLPERLESLARIERLANTGDLARSPADGRIYPNKPPGVTLLAVPVYAALRLGGRALGIDPDGWVAMTVHPYLVTVGAVGLAGALAGVLLLWVSARLFPELPPWAWTAGALTFGLGTMMWPFGTMLFDHVPVVAALLGALAALVRGADRPAAGTRWPPVVAGACLGFAILCNYLAILPAAVMVGWSVWRSRRPAALGGLALGAAAPLALLGLYHRVCFGSFYALSTTFQNERFVQPGTLLGVFGSPRIEVLAELTVLPRRGLLFSSPVLLAAILAAVGLSGRRGARSTALLCLAPFVLLLVVNASFHHWHGGGGIGPRYLMPALPFLALALAPAFARWPRMVATLAGLSVLMAGLATAVDAQPPAPIGNPWREHLLPLFLGRESRVGDVVFDGPVSANPLGSYESWYYRRFPRGSAQADWSSFNLGELVFPRSRWSLFPLGLVMALCALPAPWRGRGGRRKGGTPDPP